ncbi:uncharacterized protein LOC104906210 [Beta vulgaris subsp. vulgaris]|uniref:uncharacterized protein LOC104906210 n=1 Tax=Beta vulgaris subsp. vulgaris TaxID=3555 RepID=UPI0020373E6D|nr:uncharacterized protein LOC104906210 [Beta vulgaris subsp. vulgaris]
MAETMLPNQLTLDPNSLILSHHFDALNNPSKTLQLITDPYFMERGSRYNAYAELRELKLRSKRLKFEEDDQISELPTSEFSPVKKTVSFQSDSKKQGYSVLGEYEEDDQIYELPKSEFSPVKKTVRFQGNSKKQGYSVLGEFGEDDRIPDLPKSEYSPAKKTVRFQGNSKKQGYSVLGEFAEDHKIPELPKSEFSPLKKTVKFQGNFQGNSKKQGYSVLAQSVPDFSSTLRKENRKPVENRVSRAEKSATPPPSLSKRDKMYGSGMKLGGLGSKSVNSGEKQSSGKLMMMGRKSYANIEELKGLSIAASNSINGEKRGAKRAGNVLRKSTVFSTSTRFY